MLHKIYDFFGWERDTTLEEKEQKISDFMANLIEENKELKEKVEEYEMEKQQPPLKVALRATRKKRPWCWGILMMLTAFIQAILLASGKQKSARRHLIGILKELEYHYGFRFLAIEEGEEPDERKG